jgi:hypothetical protein
MAKNSPRGRKSLAAAKAATGVAVIALENKCVRRASLRVVRLSFDRSKCNQNNWTDRVPNGTDDGRLTGQCTFILGLGDRVRGRC